MIRNYKIYTSLAILLIVNFIFSYKYLSRYTTYGIHASIFLVILQLIVFKYTSKISLSDHSKKNISFFFLFVLVCLLSATHFLIPLESLNVDRWSVISSFLTEFYNGNYAYFSTSYGGNFPGPMPFYFLTAAPFYIIGELSILSTLGYFLITLSFIRKVKQLANAEFLLFYLFTSLFLIWEITTRSNIFTYTFLTMLALHEFSKLDAQNIRKFIGVAILIGLLLSTRIVYILPFTIFFLSSLVRREFTFKNFVFFTSIAVIAFISSFIPIIWNHKDEFFVMNPFIIQSSFLIPKHYTILFILISVILSFFVKSIKDKVFYSGLSLFITIMIYSIYHIYNFGFQESLIESSVDISYFIFCIPFLIKYLMDSRTNKV
tara:strand:+ start:970 stop:2094 length:1125 start_codon:yes stop_codon:yes gene_type:complete